MGRRRTPRKFFPLSFLNVLRDFIDVHTQDKVASDTARVRLYPRERIR